MIRTKIKIPIIANGFATKNRRHVACHCRHGPDPFQKLPMRPVKIVSPLPRGGYYHRADCQA
jgi:hypothetical protein